MIVVAIMAALLITCRRIREALSGSRERYEALVESSSEAILVSRDDVIEYANPAAVRMFGAARPADLVGRPSGDFIASLTHEGMSNGDGAVERSAQQLRTLGGALIDAEVVSSRFADSSGRAVQTTIRDIRERKRAEAALAESEQRFRSFMENSPAVAFMKDADGAYLYGNRLWHQYFNPSGRPTSDLDDEKLFSAEAAAELRRHDTDVLASDSTWQGQEDVPVNGRLRNWHVIKFPFTNVAGQRVLGGMAFDITDRIAAEEEVRRLNADLEERVRERTGQLEAVNRELEAFTYSVSHDLRAPLRGMSGFARVLEEDYGERLDDEGRRYLQIIKSNAAQMGQLIDDLLALSRMGRQPLKTATISLEQIAAEAFRQVTADEPERKIEFALEPLPACRGDANLMQQVWINLLSNAVKFTRDVTPARITVGSQETDGEHVFFVRDNGAGFDMRYVNKLFGVFQRLHGSEEFAGTGVGLAIVKRIIERHGGRIWAEGEVGRGATFYFTLGDDCHAG
jgi:PAS domain S-box-containing protein